MTFTRQFDEISKHDVALAGGKGANLGELSSAGLPVPAGFVVTTGAYDAFVEASGIKGEILALASGAENPACFEAASEWIGALFFRSGFPEKLAEEVRTAYEQMAREGQTAVAVRSSATAEDLPEASFAGQQETFLNVRGQDAVLEAVRRC